MSTDKTFTLDEIATLAEIPRRTVRYYIQCGLVDRPQGVGKGAFYTERHIHQLLVVKKWQLAGLSLDRIGAIIRQEDSAPLPPQPPRPGTVEVWSHLIVADGVEINVEPGRAGLTPEQVRSFFQLVEQAYHRVQESEDKQ